MEVKFDEADVRAMVSDVESHNEYSAVNIPGTKLSFWKRATSRGSTAAEQLSSSLQAAESSDIVHQVYEGGLKIWECARSLTAFSSTHVSDWKRVVGSRPLRVLELGCGHGLPGMAALLGGADVVHFCDFNQEVLRYVTLANIAKNCPDKLGNIRLFAGDWNDVAKLLEKEGLHYDVVLGSDTVYCLDSLVPLLNVTHAALDPAFKPPSSSESAPMKDVDDSFGGSTAFFTGRTYYFGVGGGTRDLIRTMTSSFSDLQWHRAEHFTRGVERETVAITLK